MDPLPIIQLIVTLGLTFLLYRSTYTTYERLQSTGSQDLGVFAKGLQSQRWLLELLGALLLSILYALSFAISLVTLHPVTAAIDLVSCLFFVRHQAYTLDGALGLSIQRYRWEPLTCIY